MYSFYVHRVYSFSLKFFILTRITFVDVCYDYYDRYTVVYIQRYLYVTPIARADRGGETLHDSIRRNSIGLINRIHVSRLRNYATLFYSSITIVRFAAAMDEPSSFADNT